MGFVIVTKKSVHETTHSVIKLTVIRISKLKTANCFSNCRNTNKNLLDCIIIFLKNDNDKLIVILNLYTAIIFEQIRVTQKRGSYAVWNLT